jgi:hypothetical protein
MRIVWRGSACRNLLPKPGDCGHCGGAAHSLRNCFLPLNKGVCMKVVVLKSPKMLRGLLRALFRVGKD